MKFWTALFEGSAGAARLCCALVAGLLLLGSPVSAARGPSWKLERIPGSSQLSWAAIRYLVLPEGGAPELAPAVEDFIRVAEDRGLQLEVLEGGVRAPKNSLVLLRSEAGWLRGHDGFSSRRKGNRFMIEGADSAALANGLYTLASREMGARWYWPDELGYELVGKAAAKLPDRPQRVRPSFVQRTLHPVTTDYGRRNRLNRKYAFNHNLARIFGPEVYREHPEAFSQISGQRRAPRSSAKFDPQPDFTAAATVRLSAEAARVHFDAQPEATSFSLSINDNSLFDEGLATETMVSPLNYFRELPNYTDLVFDYMNAVAEQVFADPAYRFTASGDPRYLTALAYYWTEQSPSFPLHPRVMPVLTSDRAQWHDPAYRAEDRALIRRWARSGAERIATWDYYFGAPYPYPRQFTRWIGESIPYLRSQGVDVFFSQLPSLWGLDGPKAWLATQLLWDARQDADQLLEEYYTHFFGEGAGPMRDFYETAEIHRDREEGASKWIKFYKDEAGIELFDAATLRRMRQALDRAAAAVADDPRRAARVAVVSEIFAFTEAYQAYQAARGRLVSRSLDAPATGDAGPELEAAWAGWLEAGAELRGVREALKGDPMHQQLAYFDRIAQSDPRPLALAAFAGAAAGALEGLSVADQQVLTTLRDWRAGRLLARAVNSNGALTHRGQAARNFLGPELPEMDGWRIEYRPSERLQIVAAEGAEGHGLRVSGADIVSLQQMVPVLGEQIYLLEVEAAWRVSPDNRTWVQLIWEDFSGEKLRVDVPLRLPTTLEARSGVWRLALQAPVNAYTLKAGITTNRQYAGDFLELRRVEVKVLQPAPRLPAAATD